MDIFKYLPLFVLYLLLINTATMIALTFYFWKRLDEPTAIIKASLRWGVVGCVVCSVLLFYLSADISFSWSGFSLAVILYGGAVVAGLSDARTEAV